MALTGLATSANTWHSQPNIVPMTLNY